MLSLTLKSSEFLPVTRRKYRVKALSETNLLTLKRGHLKMRNLTRQSRNEALKAREDSFSSAQQIFLISYRVASQSFSDKSDPDFAVRQQINLMPYPISRRGVVMVSS